MLNEIKRKVLEKKQILNSSNDVDVKNKKIIEIIDELLLDDNCFIKLDISTAVALLTFLGYKKNEAKELYVSLAQESLKKVGGQYTLLNLNDEIQKK